MARYGSRQRGLSRKTYEERAVAEHTLFYSNGRRVRRGVTLREGRFVAHTPDVFDPDDVTGDVIRAIGPENAKKLARNPKKYSRYVDRWTRERQAQQRGGRRRGRER